MLHEEMMTPVGDVSWLGLVLRNSISALTLTVPKGIGLIKNPVPLILTGFVPEQVEEED